MSDSNNTDDIDIDDDEIFNKYKSERLNQFKNELTIDKDIYEKELFVNVELFLKQQENSDNYVLIGGKAVNAYINIDMIKDDNIKEFIQSYDYDIIVFKKRQDFIKRLVHFLENKITYKIKYDIRELDSFNVIQLGYELNNSIKYFADFHEKAYMNYIKINDINYPTVAWTLQELYNTMVTMDDIKTKKRYERAKYLERALKKLYIFNDSFLKLLCKYTSNHSKLKEILGVDVEYNELDDLCYKLKKI